MAYRQQRTKCISLLTSYLNDSGYVQSLWSFTLKMWRSFLIAEILRIGLKRSFVLVAILFEGDNMLHFDDIFIYYMYLCRCALTDN